MTSFQKVLDKYRKGALNERDKFERILQAYLETDRQYTSQLKEVWLWEQFPNEKSLVEKI